MSKKTQPRTADGRYTFDPKANDDADLPPEHIDQRAEKLQAAHRAGKLWRMGLRGRADELARAMGAMTSDKLGGLAPDGETGRFMLFEEGEFTTCEMHPDGEIDAVGPFDPDVLPDVDEERSARMAAA